VSQIGVVLSTPEWEGFMKTSPGAASLTAVAAAMLAASFALELSERYGIREEPRTHYHQSLFWAGLVAAATSGGMRHYEKRLAALERRLADKAPLEP
jgi:hypothetical protein